MKVKIEDGCVLCGLCEGICPSVFEMGEEAAVVITDEVPENLQADVKQAAEDCPVDVIVIEYD